MLPELVHFSPFQGYSLNHATTTVFSSMFSMLPLCPPPKLICSHAEWFSQTYLKYYWSSHQASLRINPKSSPCDAKPKENGPSHHPLASMEWQQTQLSFDGILHSNTSHPLPNQGWACHLPHKKILAAITTLEWLGKDRKALKRWESGEARQTHLWMPTTSQST